MACTTILLGALVAPPAAQAAEPRWKVGDCYSRADVAKDMVDLASKVDCAKSHVVQVIGGAVLPAAFSSLTYAELVDQKATERRKALTAFAEKTCLPAKTAPGIWPKQGAQIAKALRPPASTTGGGVLPGQSLGELTSGWAFPAKSQFDAGDKSLMCVILAAGTSTGPMLSFSGDVRQLGNRNAPLAIRSCANVDSSSNLVDVPCSQPHDQEGLAGFVVRLPAKPADMTDAQWAPLDAQCKRIIEALVGAKRSDLMPYADAPANATPGALVYGYCSVQRTPGADGKAVKLPAGTVVGLGKGRL
jgi:hypothetical protein